MILGPFEPLRHRAHSAEAADEAFEIARTCRTSELENVAASIAVKASEGGPEAASQVPLLATIVAELAARIADLED